MLQHERGLEEGVALHEAVEGPLRRNQLVHAAEDEVGTLAHKYHLHAVLLCHDGSLVDLRLDAMHGSRLRSHDDGGVLSVVVHRNLHEVMHQSQLLAVGLGTLQVFVEDAGVGDEGVGVAARLEVSGDVGAVHASREEDADAVVAAVQSVYLLLYLPVDVLRSLHGDALCIGDGAIVLVMESFVEVHAVLPYIAERHIGA